MEVFNGTSRDFNNELVPQNSSHGNLTIGSTIQELLTRVLHFAKVKSLAKVTTRLKLVSPILNNFYVVG